MMQLGYASAILPDLSLEEVIQFTADQRLCHRRADVLARRQSGAPLCRRHPH